jgi:hypothetical protein
VAGAFEELLVGHRVGMAQVQGLMASLFPDGPMLLPPADAEVEMEPEADALGSEQIALPGAARSSRQVELVPGTLTQAATTTSSGALPRPRRFGLVLAAAGVAVLGTAAAAALLVLPRWTGLDRDGAGEESEDAPRAPRPRAAAEVRAAREDAPATADTPATAAEATAGAAVAGTAAVADRAPAPSGAPASAAVATAAASAAPAAKAKKSHKKKVDLAGGAVVDPFKDK